MPLLILWTSSVPTRRGNTWRRCEDGRGVTLGWHHSKNLIKWINWNGNRSSFDKFTFHYSMNSWWYPTMIWITYTLSVKPSVLKFKPSTQPNSSIWSRTISIYGTWAPQIPGIITRAIRTFSLLFRPAIVIVCVWHLDLSLICVFFPYFFFRPTVLQYHLNARTLQQKSSLSFSWGLQWYFAGFGSRACLADAPGVDHFHREFAVANWIRLQMSATPIVLSILAILTCPLPVHVYAVE